MIASKEMYIARHYIQKEKWIPAINRLKFIVTEYDNTIFIEEALHRLVEIYYKIGLVEESKKYAVLLGYNYPDSKWYKKTYILIKICVAKNSYYTNVYISTFFKQIFFCHQFG